jgi:hypothetical protein
MLWSLTGGLFAVVSPEIKKGLLEQLSEFDHYKVDHS